MSFTFAPPQRRTRSESIIPMINVVFLLLIFFLMTSQLTPPEPLEVAPPVSEAGKASETAPVLLVSAAGETAFDTLRGTTAVAAFAQAAQEADRTALLRADGGAEAATVARLLRDLAAAGLADVNLVVAPQ